MILVIGSNEEYHSKLIFDAIKAKGEQVEYYDSRDIAKNIQLSWNIKKNDGSIQLKGQRISLQEIKSVYWRWDYGIKLTSPDNSYECRYNTAFAEREFICAIQSLFLMLNDKHCLWVNSLNAIELHKRKPYQLYLMKQNNIKIPNTLIANSVIDLKDFLTANNNQLIYKPVRGGSHTQKFTLEDFENYDLSLLEIAPVTFQEFVDGVDIRVYVVGDELFAAEIRANSIDFRDDPNAELVPVELPENIKNDCRTITKLFDLKFTGIDIRKTANNEYFFIEANPSPMFSYFEEKTGYPISKNLVKLLINGKN